MEAIDPSEILTGEPLNPKPKPAQNLYAELRRADRLEKSAIAIYVDAEMHSDEALMNRLETASAFFVL